jgi:molecular chaperone GrpE
MRKQEKKLTELEPLEITSGSAQSGKTERVMQDSGQESTSAAGERAPDSVESVEPGEPVSRAEFEQLKAERDQLVDRIARLQAEFENARKRAERERLEFRDYATGSVVEQFLPVLDNFELALKSDGSADQLRSGVALIVKQMEDVLKQMQVLAVPAVGEAFDPRVHEARSSATTCPISTWPKRSAAATSCAIGCCGPLWCVWRTIPNRQANEFGFPTRESVRIQSQRMA